MTTTIGRQRWKPGVSKSTLALTAGVSWFVAGLALDLTAWSWLSGTPAGRAVFPAAIGVACGILIHHFGFLRVADRNLQRILPMEGRRCLFSFIPWTSYLLVAVMILIGALLRSSPIPKYYLSALYSAIGTALMLSSIRYLRSGIRLARSSKASFTQAHPDSTNSQGE